MVQEEYISCAKDTDLGAGKGGRERQRKSDEQREERSRMGNFGTAPSNRMATISRSRGDERIERGEATYADRYLSNPCEA
ncbi:unnamed protein product [Spirodela intermedia]|uniref:Uncharacterized protein n=1 Tax=Spirodela intermedia TaxID=51605 RepID=A0A7I8KBE1_SPIIN|nr:unnamed protein product [Spirodela intermedia]